MFSTRSAHPAGPNPLTEAYLRVKPPITPLDLACFNPVSSGIAPDPGPVQAALAHAMEAPYRPEPFGGRAAREAVAAYYAARGLAVNPDSIVLLSSTAEAYSACFKLIADPGQSIALMAPGYPLIDYLLAFEALQPVLYRSGVVDGRFAVDLDSLNLAFEADLAACLVVSPNNPTGEILRPEAKARLLRKAARRRLPVLVDEVFLDFSFGSRFAEASWVNTEDTLCFTLSGLSKTCGLAGLKLAWIVLSGPSAEVEEAKRRLALILDCSLSLNQLTEAMLPALLPEASLWQARIKARLWQNLRAVHGRCLDAKSGAVWTPNHPDGGFALVLEPRPAPGAPCLDDEALALALWEHAGLKVDPGYLYEPGGESGPASRLILSLLTPPEAFDEGLSRLLAHS